MKIKEELRSYQLEIVKQMVQLSTAAFGLIAALAWNELIKNLIDTYIKPILGVNSVIISQLIYALIVTAMAVLVTLQFWKSSSKNKRLLRRPISGWWKRIG